MTRHSPIWSAIHVNLHTQRSSRLAIAFGLLLALPAFAQLNSNCTVSILNRQAQVQADGKWRIDNVPSLSGPVRARATCVDGGVTRQGQTGLSDILPSLSTAFPSTIALTGLAVPSQLRTVPGASTLAQIGATTRLTTTVVYPDSSSLNVTAGNTGTRYFSSNPQIVTVSADGLITASGVGTAIVTATYDGVTGIVQPKRGG